MPHVCKCQLYYACSEYAFHVEQLSYIPWLGMARSIQHTATSVEYVLDTPISVSLEQSRAGVHVCLPCVCTIFGLLQKMLARRHGQQLGFQCLIRQSGKVVMQVGGEGDENPPCRVVSGSLEEGGVFCQTGGSARKGIPEGCEPYQTGFEIPTAAFGKAGGSAVQGCRLQAAPGQGCCVPPAPTL